MKTPLIALLLVVVLVSAGSSDAKPKETKPAAAEIKSLSVEELIARFQDEPASRVQEDEAADIDTFVTAPPPTRFRVDLRGTTFPRVSSTMRELTRRGIVSIPALLDHLSDARPTKLSLSGGPEGSEGYVQFLGSEYDPRQPGANNLPPGAYGINKSEPGRGVERFDTYQLKVGDLCFAALGQIVNRRLIGLRNFSGFMYGFNSPVHSPGLAAAARADWTGLADDDFRGFLTREVQSLKKPAPDLQPRNLSALERLLFYYPADGVVLAVKLLERPLIDTAAADTCRERLMDADSEAEQDRLLAEFREQHGQNDYQCLVQSVVHAAAQPLDLDAGNTHPWALKAKSRQANMVGIANRCLTEAERNPTFVDSQFDCTSRREAVETMMLYPSAEIDTAIRRLLQHAFALRPEHLLDKENQRALVVACAKRLLPPARYRAFEKASYAVGRKWDSATNHKENAPTYVRANDAFLQKLAADPALQLPAGQP